MIWHVKKKVLFQPLMHQVTKERFIPQKNLNLNDISPDNFIMPPLVISVYRDPEKSQIKD